jgi:hypothetical protein
MTILLIGSVLFGAVLGRFFKFLILVPACAFVLGAVLVGSADVDHGLLRQVLEFAVLITSLQIGYVLGLISSFATRKSAPCALVTPTAATVGRDAEVRRDAVSGQGLTHLLAAGFANPEVDEFSEAEWVKRSVRPRPRNEV